MKITVQLTPEDYIAAHRLNMRPRPAFKVLLYCLLPICIFGAGVPLYEFFIQGKPFDHLFWLLPAGGLYFYVTLSLLPAKNIRRIFQQQKDLQSPTELEFTDTHVHGRSERGSLSMLWPDFHAWKQNEKLVLLFQSEALMHIVPKRCFDSPRQIEELQAILLKTIGPGKQ